MCVRPAVVSWVVVWVLLVLFCLTTCLAQDTQQQQQHPVPTTVDSGGDDSSPITVAPDTKTTQPAHAPEIYDDVTDFLKGVNEWDFMGVWGKYDLLKLKEEWLPVPLIDNATDQGVLVCHASMVPSMLEKTFPALTNAKFFLTYFVSSPEKDISMAGEIVEDREGGRREFLYNYTYPDDLQEHNYTWVTQSFSLPNLTADGTFKILLTVGRGKMGVWATGMVRVMGEVIPPTTPPPPPPPPPVPSTTPAPPINTTAQPTLTTVEVNVTTTPLLEVTTTELVNTTGPPDNTTTGPPDNTTTGPPDITTIGPSDNITTGHPDNITTGPPDNITTGPPDNTTGPPDSTTEAGGNVTAGPPGGKNNSTWVTEPIIATSPQPPPPGHGEELKQLQGVAAAIWDAFFVFLALFCACLVALIALIVVRSRWCKRGDDPPPTVSNYNSRTSSYRLDKVYDNPSYDNNAV